MLKPKGVLTYKDEKDLYLRLVESCEKLGLEIFVIGLDCEYFDWDSNNKIYNLIYYSPFDSTLYLDPCAILFKDFNTSNFSIYSILDLDSGETDNWALGWTREKGGFEAFQLMQHISERAQTKYTDLEALNLQKEFFASEEKGIVVNRRPKFLNLYSVENKRPDFLYDPFEYCNALCIF